MILNGDYFNDIEITSDIITGEGTTELPKDNQTGYDFILCCEKHYTDSLSIEFELHTDEFVYPVAMKQRQTILDSLFNSYGIEYSELYLKDIFEVDNDTVEVDGHILWKYNIYDYGYKHLACKDPKIKRPADDYKDRWVELHMHFNMPAFNEQQGMRFLYYLSKALFKNNELFVNYFHIDGGYYYSKYGEEIVVNRSDIESSENYDMFCKTMLNGNQRDNVLGCLCRNNKETQQ